ncbi:MAG: hypothetical protein R3190_00405 [Thermoanaerobaculia bacterium]|nr:hypothetical protein [Thermoanaerobaculia bacterium]
MTRTSGTGREGFIKAQRRLLDVQRNALDSGFEVLTRLQEQQRELTGRFLEQIPNMPDEIRGISDAWWQARISGRETFKSAIDRSFDLVEGYYERLAEPVS